MTRPTLFLALAGASAVVAGLVVGFFELTIAGIVAAAVAAALWRRDRGPARSPRRN